MFANSVTNITKYFNEQSKNLLFDSMNNITFIIHKITGLAKLFWMLKLGE